jgi:hypothetical protein
LQLCDVPSAVQDFVEGHEGHHRQLALGLVWAVPFQRKKQPAIGTKGLYPGLIEPALASYGEVVVPAADGSTDFAVLQNELKGQSTKIYFTWWALLSGEVRWQ